MIRAGKIDEILWSTGKWMFIDMGFSSKSPTCGVLFHDSKPERKIFAETVKDVITVIKTYPLVNLVIESPLSVAFDNGNPIGRSIEKQGNKARYWYVGPGCVVLVGALYLMKNIISENPTGEVRLFEGFVSYKTEKSDHMRDVEFLRDVVKDPVTNKKYIYDISDNPGIESAFKVIGFNYGIPPIIMKSIVQ